MSLSRQTAYLCSRQGVKNAKVDRIVPDPRCGIRKGDGDLEVHRGPIRARAEGMETMRVRAGTSRSYLDRVR